jgi:FdhD protein
MGRVTVRPPVLHIEGFRSWTRPDAVAVEEPLEIRVDGAPLAVTMRTPGDDIDLALGFLTTEGVITSAEDVRQARFCAGADDTDLNTYNVLDVALTGGLSVPTSAERHFYVSSSCGVCGKASIDAVRTRTAYPVGDDPLVVSTEVLAQMPTALRAHQGVFDQTGGLHAAALFAVDGSLVAVREDVGRHNAVDKIVGDALRRHALPLREHVLLVSGRASFELVQKALMAGLPAIAAISAPSSLAVELAIESGMTLVGFLRGDTMNVYAGAQRVRVGVPAHVD